MVIITVPLTTGSTPTPFCQVGENKNEKKISAFKSYPQRSILAWCILALHAKFIATTWGQV